MQDLFEFERKLIDSLKKLLDGALPKSLGAAVSGGADSVSLLCALARARDVWKADGKKDFPNILCVTVDHSIRPEEESSGDAAFVQDLCKKLDVPCCARKIERGAVENLAAQRGKGVEEAARLLRYQEFEAFAKESGAEYICLAHNQNDALETLLMRFLQGSSAAYGICAKRGIYLRPLLDFSRAQIEEYLRQINVGWRTDSTNSDNNYFRNKVRNLLTPFLDKNFDGWKKALLSGGEKAMLENEALDAFLDQALAGVEGSGQKLLQDKELLQGQNAAGIEISRSFFEGLPVALRQRFLYRSFEKMGLEERVPYSFVRALSFWPEKDFKKAAAAGLEAVSKKDKVFLKKAQKEATESGFFDIIVGKEGAAETFVERTRAVGDKL
ncbi:MAG: tRNA lysidine(34) synthetase TilS [Treponema sp.]|nr:tRNA lysidine(34) synthetase TilS [Treponema sp.]